MLWEADDPHLQPSGDRFGFGEPPRLAAGSASCCGSDWGVDGGVCERVVMSDRNALAWVTAPSGPVLAKWSVASERFEALAQIARLTSWFDGHGMPVSAPLPALDGSLPGRGGRCRIGVPAAQIEGRLLDTAAPAQVQAAGAALARMQGALAGYPDASRAAARPVRTAV